MTFHVFSADTRTRRSAPFAGRRSFAAAVLRPRRQLRIQFRVVVHTETAQQTNVSKSTIRKTLVDASESGKLDGLDLDVGSILVEGKKAK